MALVNHGEGMILVPSGQSKCKRCGRWFQPKESDQEYGPVCARKMAAMQTNGQLFIASDGVMIRNEMGNLCRGCGADLSDEPDWRLCDECLDVPVQIDNCDPDNLFGRRVIV